MAFSIAHHRTYRAGCVFIKTSRGLVDIEKGKEGLRVIHIRSKKKD
jgi:hypothetical protein